jgi:hypothetical protein
MPVYDRHASDGNLRCAHPQHIYVRHGPHVADVCTACCANVQGRGRWVPHAELHRFGIRLDDLPQLEDLQATIARRLQPTLWRAGA